MMKEKEKRNEIPGKQKNSETSMMGSILLVTYISTVTHNLENNNSE